MKQNHLPDSYGIVVWSTSSHGAQNRFGQFITTEKGEKLYVLKDIVYW